MQPQGNIGSNLCTDSLSKLYEPVFSILNCSGKKCAIKENTTMYLYYLKDTE